MQYRIIASQKGLAGRFGQKIDSYGREKKDWTREEHILEFNLYCKIPFGQIHMHNRASSNWPTCWAVKSGRYP